ncbi:hypothetical protein J5Y04_04385 [Kitasatospora sp. RG8]|uniref:hypothetical protein n=1 Tax=Kitasatospora sp. RG8 TaxID=2820815 RepID=UPI001ADF3326|nr:hypothetical protein [Kitasatospora sp. RG8]MBP0448781.1 hypothetical protein [Kitasatospora sp. RG8]
MTARALAGLAAGDFRDRVRRPVYTVTLLAAVGLGYLAVPPAGGHWVILAVGRHRGEYNSAYVGLATALAGALWLTVGGFYVVRKGIGRDEETRVGQILAATPLRTSAYLVAKFLGNLLVLGSMLGVLALTAAAMQLVRGEHRAIDPVALLTPFVVTALPLLAVTAAAAVLFETLPLLRGGAGNVAWFLVSLVVVVGGQSPGAPFGGLGVGQAAGSLRAAALAAGAGPVEGQEFSLGLTKVDTPLAPFPWAGAGFDGGFALQRLLLVLLSVALVVLPALWFGRFDPARGRPAGASVHPAAAEAAAPAAPPAPVALPRTAPAFGGTFGRLLAGEVRILAGGVSPWWWLVTAGLTVAGLTVPIGAVTGFVLPALWVWPVLIWSGLGSRQAENDLEVLVGAYPAARRRLLAEWASGVVLAAVTGAAPLIRLAVAGDAAGLAAWAAGALFVPSLAMALGVLSRTHLVFQALYLPLWYLVVNQVAALDYMGAVRTAGHLAGPGPLLVLAAALALLATAFVAGAARREVRATR